MTTLDHRAEIAPPTPRRATSTAPFGGLDDGQASDEAFWLRHLMAGLILYIAATAVSALYLGLTPTGPHRRLEWVMVLISCSLTAFVVILPRRAIVRSRRRLTFFGAWSVFSCGFIALVTIVDGGLGSPLYTLIFIPVAFASLAYPAWLVTTIGGVAIGATGVIQAVSANRLPQALVFGGVIAMVTALAAMVAAKTRSCATWVR